MRESEESMEFGGHLSRNYIGGAASKVNDVNKRNYLNKGGKQEGGGGKAEPIKFQPNWWFITFLITMLSI